MTSALDKVVEFVEIGNRVHTIFAANPEKNYSVPRDPLLHEMFRRADLIIPDGIGMVVAGRLLFGKCFQRVPGCELMQEICGLAGKKSYPIYLFGASEAVNQSAAAELKRRHPHLTIAGRSNGYVKEADYGKLVDEINASGARILFLALGSPRQENWISTHGDQLKHVRVCQGIGGTLDVIAGRVKRAPRLFCCLGLEWFYRLITDPCRMKRQAKLPLFAGQITLAKLNR